MRSDRSRKRFVFLCVAPATILFFIFMILPTLNVFRMSLYERGAYSPNETFVGLKNFQHLLKDTQFIRSMQNMILLVVVVTIITFAFALVFAAILTREKIKGQNFFRIIFYIPNILSVVVISGIFSAIYKPENGMLNSIIGLFRDMTDPILWKGEKLVIPSIIIAMVWQAVGYYMVMYMASMSSVPASLYESANLDGAGRLTQFFQITIPLVWTNIRTTLTFFIISTINMAFLFVKAMTSGGPNGASDVALNYMYSQKDAGLYGYSMAIGVVIFLFSFALSACVNRATSREPWSFKEENYEENGRKILPFGGGPVQIFYLFCADPAGCDDHCAGGMGVYGIHQAELGVLRQSVGTACRILLAELRQCVEWSQDGRIYAQLRSGHSAGSGAVAGDCAAGSLLPVPFPVQGEQAAEHAVYGRSVHQCQLYRSSHLPDAA